MDDFEKIALKEMLRLELGDNAHFYEYKQKNRAPMTFVMDEVKRQIGDIFSVYWVEGGHPEVFCLNGFSKTPIVFNTRYLSLSVFIRQLLVSEHFENISDIAESIALQLVAELALRKGDPDLAVLAFIKSRTGKRITNVWGADGKVDIMALEYEAKNEAYMSMWFYGLVHECGHLAKYQSQIFPKSHIFSDENIQKAIETALGLFSYPEEIKKEALAKATNKANHSVLEINHLRSEGLADIFACSVMLKTTYEIMKEIGQQELRAIPFIQETVIFHNIIGFMDRCRRVAAMASATDVDRETRLENVLHPVSIAARSLIQRQYLNSAITQFLYGDKSTEDQYEIVTQAIDQINEAFINKFDKIESGMGKACEFLLFPGHRKNDWVLLDEYRKDLLQSPAGMAMIELNRFCDMADSLGKESKLLKALKGIQANPKKKPIPDPTGDLLFNIPWIEGPNNFSRPFGLDTKHGHLIFAFLTTGDLYNEYFITSAESLKYGYKLKSAAVLVPRKEQLGQELAANMPQGLAFQVIVEGTEEFILYMKELSDNSIWE